MNRCSTPAVRAGFRRPVIDASVADVVDEAVDVFEFWAQHRSVIEVRNPNTASDD